MAIDWINCNKKYFLYIIICFAYLSNGLDLSLVGPSIKDLAALMNTTDDHVLYGFTIRSVANGASSLVALYTLNKFSRQLQYTLSIFIYGIATIFLPYLTKVKQYLILSGFFGFTSSYIDISTNLFVFELFQNQNLNFHVQCVFFCIAIGQTLGPLILGPFLAASNEKSVLNNTVTNQTVPNDEIVNNTSIFIPFTIGGGLFVLCSIAMLICWIISPYRPPNRTVDGKDIDKAKRDLKSKEENELIVPSQSFYLLFISLVICLNATVTTMEYQFNYFISIYLENYFKIKGYENTNLLTLLGFSYVIGRALVVLFTTFKLSVTKIMYLNCILLLSGSILIAFISPSSNHLLLLLSIGVILMGLGYSSCQPCMFVVIENRINITSTLNASMIATQTALFYIESSRMIAKIGNNPESFKSINLSYTIAFTIFFLLLHLTDLIKKNFLTVKKIS